MLIQPTKNNNFDILIDNWGAEKASNPAISDERIRRASTSVLDNNVNIDAIKVLSLHQSLKCFFLFIDIIIITDFLS